LPCIEVGKLFEEHVLYARASEGKDSGFCRLALHQKSLRTKLEKRFGASILIKPHGSIQRKEKGMIVKLDMANAFDRVNHNFLASVLKIFGFSIDFIETI